jgi:hypothetical protein
VLSQHYAPPKAVEKVDMSFPKVRGTWAAGLSDGRSPLALGLPGQIGHKRSSGKGACAGNSVRLSDMNEYTKSTPAHHLQHTTARYPCNPCHPFDQSASWSTHMAWHMHSMESSTQRCKSLLTSLQWCICARPLLMLYSPNQSTVTSNAQCAWKF